jgi:hypothetical protein
MSFTNSSVSATPRSYPGIAVAALGAPAAGGGGGGSVEMTRKDALLQLRRLVDEVMQARKTGCKADYEDLAYAYTRLHDQWPSISLCEIAGEGEDYEDYCDWLEQEDYEDPCYAYWDARACYEEPDYYDPREDEEEERCEHAGFGPCACAYKASMREEWGY